ncbi:MAG: hypothetical protein KGL18_18545 [Burkholderiales bacterium]|nr:hypothetical protein [Burkholderiales bacterium]MDE1928331.1 hypothetical protein [Burkholderiales bacterium]MDE2157712.1 hypothetical protein [Burkholderiales bacterium]MDE2504968.1 hypothetical protein [Burkholderiales bacterium]
MTIVLNSSRHATLPAPVAAHRVLQCIAGFYLDQRAADAVLLGLRSDHGLLLRQTSLFRPREAGSLRLAWHVRRWTGCWPFHGGTWLSSIVLALLFGVLTVAAMAGLWVTLDFVLSADGLLQGLILPWVLVCAATVVAVAMLLMQARLPRPRRFDGAVRRQLASGHWAVVVNGIPPARQQAVLSRLQRDSVAWSAEAQPMQPI